VEKGKKSTGETNKQAPLKLNSKEWRQARSSFHGKISEIPLDVSKTELDGRRRFLGRNARRGEHSGGEDGVRWLIRRITTTGKGNDPWIKRIQSNQNLSRERQGGLGGTETST